jgi:hypothetical protein
MMISSDRKEMKKGVNSLNGSYGSVKDVVMDDMMDGKAKILDEKWLRKLEDGRKELV